MTGEAGWLNQRLQLSPQRFSLACLEARAKADVMQQPTFVIQTKQQRSDNLLFGRIAEASDDAVCGPREFYFLHSGAVSRGVGTIQSFGDNAIQVAAHGLEPFFGNRDV